MYNTWLRSLSAKFRTHEDTTIFACLFVQQSEERELLCYQIMPYSLGIFTSAGKLIIDSFRIDIVFIGSTFKTNRKRLELLTVIVSCTELGILLAHFLIELGTSSAYSSIQESLTLFLTNLKEKIPTLKPHFFFTDKEMAQIQAI